MSGKHEWVYADKDALVEALQKRNLDIRRVAVLMGYSASALNVVKENRMTKRMCNALVGYLTGNGIGFTEEEKEWIFAEPKKNNPKTYEEKIEDFAYVVLMRNILNELKTLNKSVADITAEQLVQGRYIQEIKSKVERTENNICKIEKRVTYMRKNDEEK